MKEESSTTYRPVFVLWIALLQQLFWQTIFAIWAVGLFGSAFGDQYWKMAGPPTTLMSVFLPFIIVFAVAFVAFPVVVSFVRAMNYRTTIYRLYADRIEIEEGFLTIHAKRLMFRDVREVSLRRGVLQRSVGLGSVYIATQATGTGVVWNPFGLFGIGSTFGSGAMIKDIPDASQAYERLRGLVDEARRD